MTVGTMTYTNQELLELQLKELAEQNYQEIAEIEGYGPEDSEALEIDLILIKYQALLETVGADMLTVKLKAVENPYGLEDALIAFLRWCESRGLQGQPLENKWHATNACGRAIVDKWIPSNTSEFYNLDALRACKFES